ncbi:hypothetical protein P175DRAFT_0435921 [Aspergillus ochraceoroseus IBT 24754]|uniref:Fatty acid hydroxylase domain-containing protein n=2 Tax=Aspergillus ochraceoroseus TaxID=138278 RepID=A0A2T5LZA1_9EURO|nr:uncharacterized protein P175DRAFT_0435921 [Aspergillus ochraceoroseus IBT 24754]KKK11873.1 hypothetical protein AOCH_005393 [Aspergillus ochraceoroseus]PTU21610.1 hypothetical protein P175DRAFT_0435921 [Aspergillus ochraceoroseus IBT 24754]
MASHPNTNDSMKSTWRQQDRSKWTIFHWMYEWADIHPIDLHRDIPKHAKHEKIPYMSDWQLQRWILFHAGATLVLHQVYLYLTGHKPGPILAFLYYYAGVRIFTARHLRAIRNLGHTYGFLDGDQHDRDGVPDVGVKKALIASMLAAFVRPLMTVFLTYDADKPPISMNWTWLLVEVSLYGIVLDFWFYWYHRLMHQVHGLWKYHRTHHLTKHPNPLLTIYADSEQEFFDIVGIPLMAYATMRLMGLPMGFYEWYICQLYVMFAELAGHSGLRLHASPPNPLTWLMRIFDAEMVIEDHDLHHRIGWRNSHNYGKQTRIWDRVFGTCSERIESAKDNVDYEHPATMPIF